MNVYELVFLIVLVVTVGKLIERRLGRHHGRSKPADGASRGASAVRTPSAGSWGSSATAVGATVRPDLRRTHAGGRAGK